VKRERIDKLLVERGLVQSRERARRLLMAGAVRVAGQVVDKPGATVDPAAEIRVEGGDIPFVSRGGLKLAGALDRFGIDVRGVQALDVGASTGGFTDCLLQRGARAVVAVDVGYGQFDWKLRNDPRVTLIERANVRHLEAGRLPFAPDFCAIDVSFISLTLVLPAIVPLLTAAAQVLPLVKPQFEVGKGQVGKGGVVRDPQLQRAAVERVRAAAGDCGLSYRGECESPLLGPKGNREFFLHLQRRAGGG